MTNRTALHELDPGSGNDGDVPTLDLASGSLVLRPPSGVGSGSSGQIPSGTSLPATVTDGELFALITPGSTGSSTWASLVQSKPLLGWYRHGEAAGSTTMVDSSGQARNGNYTGSPTLGTPGLISGSSNTAATFAGSQSGTVPSPTWLNGLSAVSFVQRIKPSAFNAMLIERDSEGGLSRQFQIRLSASGGLELIFWDAANGLHSGSGGSTSTAAGNTIGVSVGSGNVKGYINGAQVVSFALTGALATVTRDLQIGASPTVGWSLSGVVDETVIVGGELSATDHADLHNAAVNGTAGTASPDTVELYYGENGQWVLASGGGASTLDALSDVSVTGAADKQALVFDVASGLWKPAALRGLPAGGGTGQALKKASPADFDVVWGDDLQGSGGGSGGSSASLSIHTPPATANAKDDEFADLVGQSGPTRGLASKWTKRGTSSFDTSGTVGLEAGYWNIAAGDDWDQKLHQPAPAGDFTAVVRMELAGVVNRQMWGLFLVDASGNGQAIEVDNGDLAYVRTVSGWNVGGTVVAALNVSPQFFAGLPIQFGVRRVGSACAWWAMAGDRNRKPVGVATTLAGSTIVGFGRVWTGTGAAQLLIDYSRVTQP